MAASSDQPAHEIVIVRRRGGDHDDGHHGGTWKIAFADFMTAMMAFFLVMWLINSTDEKTVSQVASYFNPLRLNDQKTSAKGVHDPGGAAKASAAESSEAGKKKEPPSKPAKERPQKGAGKSQPESEAARHAAQAERDAAAEQRVFADPFALLAGLSAQFHASDNGQAAGAGAKTGESRAVSGRDPFDPGFLLSQNAARAEPPSARSTPPARDAAAGSHKPPPASPAGGDDPSAGSAAKLAEEIKSALAGLGASKLPGVDVRSENGEILISLSDKSDVSMFKIGSAEPSPALVVVTELIGKRLASRLGRVAIRGHTDGRPYRSTIYDNWRLSSARAQMAYHMLVRGGLDERRVERIEGWADRKLLMPDQPDASINRRIEILVKPEV